MEPRVPAGVTTLGRLRWERRYSSQHVAEIGAVLPAASPNPPRPHMEMRLLWHGLPGTTQLLEKCICKNRSCCGRKPTRKQASVALRSR